MRTSPLAVLVGVIGLLSLGCMNGGGGGGSDDFGSSDEEVETLLYDARVVCDPTANTWDDLFTFEAETASGVDLVEVDVYAGSSLTGTVRLSERGDGNWYGEEDADDLDADCDSFNGMFFDFIATKGSNTESLEVNP